MTDKKNRTVLAIDDSRTDMFLLQAHLNKMGLTVLSADNAQKGIEIASIEHPDIILLDVMLPDIDGFEVCKRLKADSRTSDIVVIFVSANDEPCDKIEGLKAGAVDYISKPYNMGELKARIESVLRTIDLEEKLLSASNTDELTGLSNRRHFFDILEREIFQARIKGSPMTMMMLDIDHFKEVNDTYGHSVGDMVLRQMGKILRENTHPLDLVARYGGEEFIISMPETSGLKAAQAAEKLRRIVNQWRWDIGEKRILVTVSIGVASVDSTDSQKIIKKADDALYAAKKQGRNCVVCWQEGDTGKNAELAGDEYQELQTKVSSLSQQIRLTAVEVISSFIKTLAIKDPYTATHSKNTQAYALAIADQLQVSQELREKLEVAALLHDIGKVGVPDWILQKTGPLGEYDRTIVEQHTLAGVEILEPIGVFAPELPLIRQHHERVDGTGYPDRLKGNEISFGARILAVADVFDAMTSDRPYRTAKSAQQALQEIIDGCGTQFDADVVDAFQQAYQQNREQWPLTNQDLVLSLVQELTVE